MLLTRALSLLDPAEAESMAVAVGEEYGRSLAAQMSPGDSQRSMRAAMRAVADALTAHGFAAHADASEPRDDPPTVVADHCPFGEVALRHPVLCSVDHGMVQGMLAGLCGYEVPVKMSSRARGDASCTTVAG
jgi:predicted ArsR family transcriptional regulator